MEMAAALLAGGAPGSEASFSLFAQSLNPVWVEQALTVTGTATIRRRKLPAEYVVWLVIGMAMLRDRSIAEVVRHLDLVMPTPTGERQHVSGSAVVQARTAWERSRWLGCFTPRPTLGPPPRPTSIVGADWRSWGWMARRDVCPIHPRTTRTSVAQAPAAATRRPAIRISGSSR